MSNYVKDWKELGAIYSMVSKSSRRSIEKTRLYSLPITFLLNSFLFKINYTHSAVLKLKRFEIFQSSNCYGFVVVGFPNPLAIVLSMHTFMLIPLYIWNFSDSWTALERKECFWRNSQRYITKKRFKQAIG